MANGHVCLEGPDARHLSVVRRARPEDRIKAGDGRGRVVEASIESISPERVSAAIVQETTVPPPGPRMTVLQGLARRSKIDFVVQKLAELGVDRIVVFEAGRSVPRWDEAKGISMRRRWERICYEASKQSQRAWLPEVDGPLDLDGAVNALDDVELCLIAEPVAPSALKDALPAQPPSSVAAVVGPEGGLEEGEVARFHTAGAKAVSMGAQILRTETAGLAIAAVLMFHFGRLG